MLRQLVVSLTIVSLLSFHITGLGVITSAQAETATVSSSVNDSLLYNPDIKTKSTEETRTENKAKAQSKVKNYDGLEQSSGVGKIFSAEGFLQLLTMLAIGQIGKSLMFACAGVTSQPDVMLFIGGAVAYFAGEVQAWLRYKNLEKVRLTYTDGALSGEQRKALEGQLEAYRQMLSIAKTKYSLQMAAAAAFAAAAAAAGARYMQTKLALSQCQMELFSVANTCVPQCTALTVGAAACEAAITPCMEASAAGIKAIIAMEQQATQQAPSMSLFTPISAEAKALTKSLVGACSSQPCAFGATAASSCAAILTGYELTWVSCKPTAFFSNLDGDFFPKILGKEMSKVANSTSIKFNPKDDIWSEASIGRLIKKFFDLMLPQAQAIGGITELLGISGAAYSLYLGTEQAQAVWMDSMIFHPLKRAAAFGVTATLAGSVAMMTKSNIGKIEEHIAKLEQILNTMGTSATTATLAAINQNARIPIATAIRNSSNAAAAAFPCVMVGNSRQGCSSMTSAYNNAVNENASKGITLDSLGSSFAQLGQLSGKVVDSIQGQGTLSQGALGSADELASKNAMAQKLMTDTFKAIDDQAKKNGQPSNLGEMNKKILANVQAATLKVLQAKGVNPATAAAAIGVLDPVTKEEQKKAGTINEKSLTSIAASGGISAAVQSGLPSFGGSFVANDEGISKGDITTASGTGEAVMDMTKAGDINNNSDVSIFEILTQRYFKTGLDKLGIEMKAQNDNKTAPAKAP